MIMPSEHTSIVREPRKGLSDVDKGLVRRQIELARIAQISEHGEGGFPSQGLGPKLDDAREFARHLSSTDEEFDEMIGHGGVVTWELANPIKAIRLRK